MMRLDGKRAAIIGAGSVGDGIGNGRAIAMLFAQEGAKVLAVDRDADAVGNTIDRIRATDPASEAHAITLDATSGEDLERLVSEADQLWGGLDILVHVVGMNLPGNVVDTTPEDWDRVFDVNLKSAYLAAHHVLPGMIEQGGGALVFISSIASIWSGPYSYVGYEASKAGLNRLTQSIARGHAAEGIRANVVLPGMIDTPHVQKFIHQSQSATSDARAASVPMKRQGTSWDIAEAALFLASDASSYVTGVCLPVDGGLTL